MEYEDLTARHSNGGQTVPNNLSHKGTEEQNGASTPQQLNQKNPFEGRTTHLADDLWTYVSLLTYIADVVTDLLICVKYYRERNVWWFVLSLGFVSVASFAIQLFSAKWLLEDGKQQSCFTNVLHVLQLGPVWR